jgi:hypothetical protein
MRLVNGLVEKLGKSELAKNVVFVDNGNHVCPDTDNSVCAVKVAVYPAKAAIALYEDTPGGMENILGSVPDFMRFLPEGTLIRDWPLWKMVGEIDMERATYLLSIDRLLEEML